MRNRLLVILVCSFVSCGQNPDQLAADRNNMIKAAYPLIKNYYEDIYSKGARTEETSTDSTGGIVYYNIPKNKDDYKATRDCKSTPKGDCVLAALPRYRDQLLSPATSAGARAIALKLIIHLVGDMHQPLHCADNHDFGGGGVTVWWFNDKTNLHKVWDTRIIGRAQLTDEEFVQGLIDGSTPQDMNAMRDGTMLEWALESHQLAREFAYAVPANNHLSSDYYQRNWPVVDQQLLRAGMRLARVLDWIFAPHTGANTSDPLVLQH